MPVYQTPNVFVEEVPTLPPSVVPVATAVPAFIGYTEKSGSGTDPVVVKKINSMLDYEHLFGGASPTKFTVTFNAEGLPIIAPGDGEPVTPKFLMHYTLRLFFNNGGSSCYIVSVGNYGATPSADDFEKGLKAIYKEDEPTLLLLTDAINLSKEGEYYKVCQKALKQCSDLKDRFAIFDVLHSDSDDTAGIGASFRSGIDQYYLKYGAAYYPYLKTTVPYQYTDESITVDGLPKTDDKEDKPVEFSLTHEALLITYTGSASDTPKLEITTHASRAQVAVEKKSDGNLEIKVPTAGSTVAEILAVVTDANTIAPYKIQLASSDSNTTPIRAISEAKLLTRGGGSADGHTLKSLKTSKTELYNTIKATLNVMTVTMPPSGAIAGVYAKTDRERGVWKAPANVSLASVIGPTVKLTNDDQDTLNVDANSGKSINAIRSFTGKGTLVWGARTLAGNDNEWRYISVRRLFNLIEESIQKATSFVVFESNSAITWLKVKTLIETYLEGLWRQGALAGATQKQAYFVAVGLGQTMTPQDILEGRMIIEIGVAAVRPAEFIVLRFSHKLQEA